MMDGHDGFADVIGGNDIDAIGRAKRKDRQTGKYAESLNHIELRGFGPPAIAQYDGRTKNCARDIGEQLMNHVLAEFFRAGVGIVIRARPIDSGVFVNHFVLARSSDRDRGDVRKAPQPVVILRTASELNDFKRAAQIHVEALLF